MAYANWGAKVWKNGKARHKRCDTSADEALGFYDKNLDVCHFDTSGHAIIGDKRTKIAIIIYKNYIQRILKYDDKRWKLSGSDLSGFKKHKSKKPNGMVYTSYGSNIEVWYEKGNIHITLGDWEAVSGMELGEGYEEWGDKDEKN